MNPWHYASGIRGHVYSRPPMKPLREVNTGWLWLGAYRTGGTPVRERVWHYEVRDAAGHLLAADSACGRENILRQCLKAVTALRYLATHGEDARAVAEGLAQHAANERERYA